MKKKILYISFESLIESPIIKSQVVPLLNAISTEYDITLVTFEKGLSLRANESFSHIGVSSSYRLIQFIKLLYFLIKNKQHFDIIHIRSYMPMLPVIFLKKTLFKFPKIVFDLRGVYPEELELKYQKTNNKKHLYLFRFFKKMELYFLKYADENIVVSHAFKEYLIEQYYVTLPTISNHINVIPTFSKPNLLVSESNKIKLPFSKESILFVYSGSIDIWQKFNETVELFKLINKEILNAKFLVLTYETEKAKKTLEIFNINKEDYYITKCTSLEIFDYLKQAHFAFLLRDLSIINQVSSPIKFQDYINCNLKLIISRKIGDTEALVKKHELGVFIDSFSNMSKFVKHNVEYFQSHNKKSDFEAVKNIFAFEKAKSQYLNVYKKLI